MMIFKKSIENLETIVLFLKLNKIIIWRNKQHSWLYFLGKGFLNFSFFSLFSIEKGIRKFQLWNTIPVAWPVSIKWCWDKYTLLQYFDTMSQLLWYNPKYLLRQSIEIFHAETLETSFKDWNHLLQQCFKILQTFDQSTKLKKSKYFHAKSK